MAFKPKKKVEAKEIESKEDLKKISIEELKKQIAEVQKEIEEAEEVEEEPEEEVEQEVSEIEPKKEVAEQSEQLKLTAEEVISAIEFNIGRAGQLLQLLKQ